MCKPRNAILAIRIKVQLLDSPPIRIARVLVKGIISNFVIETNAAVSCKLLGVQIVFTGECELFGEEIVDASNGYYYSPIIVCDSILVLRVPRMHRGGLKSRIRGILKE